MAINAYLNKNKPVDANMNKLGEEEAELFPAAFLKGDTGPAGPQGPPGEEGQAATITVGSTTTGPAGSSASVTNSGTAQDAVLNFTIPKGDKGDTGSAGAAATIAVGTVSTVGPTDPATVTNSGTSSAAVFNFEIPKGDKGDQGPKGDDGGIFYAVCDTAATTVTKAVTIAGVSALTAGLCVNVKFTYTNSASNPKLQINSLEAKPIYQYGTTAIGTAAATTSWQPGAVVQLTYDGTGFVRDQGYNTNSTYTVDSVLCATSASTAAKVSTNAGYYVLRAGNIFEITFRYTNTKQAALTLNVNGTGALPIYINGVVSSATNYTLPAGKYICYTDGTNYYINTSGKAPINITGKADGNHDIPSGGSAGKVLKKSSATDYDVEWGDADARNIWYATCSTATGTADKVATSATGDFVLAEGNMCVVNFTYYNNQTEPYLSIDGCTKQRIKERSGTGQITTALWRDGESITVVYDGTDFIVVEGGTASTSYYGVTKLSNSYSSTSQSLAATPQAVKYAYDLAAAAYSPSNPPPTPSKSDVGLGNVDNVQQYSASNPPPNDLPPGGTTGQALTKSSNDDYDVGWETISAGGSTPTVVTDNTSYNHYNWEEKTYTVSGSGVVVVFASNYSSADNDNGTSQTVIYHNNVQVMAAGIAFTPQKDKQNGSFAGVPLAVSNGDTIKISVLNGHSGTRQVYRRFLCFGCTVTLP